MIKPAKPENLNVIAKLYKTCVKEMNERGLFNWNNSYPSNDIISYDIEENQLFVFLEDNKIIAVVCLDENEPEEYRALKWKYAGPSLFVHRLAVHPDRRNRKVAEKLMIFARDHAIEKKYRSIRLDVLTKNPQASRLYEKCGYEKVGIIHFSYLSDPFCCMELDLSEETVLKIN